MPEDGALEIDIKSPGGIWHFDGVFIRDGSSVCEPFTIDFFERWTFARFLSDSTLATAFESSQPWSEYGSYGDRLGGVQVLRFSETRRDWDLVSIEFDSRHFDEKFVTRDIVWHPRGVLAWLRDGLLEGQVLREPRGVIWQDLVPARDSSSGLAFCFDLGGEWQALSLDDEGRMLRATGDDGVLLIDLLERRRSQDDGEWEILDEQEP